jgi:rhamnosyltransferase
MDILDKIGMHDKNYFVEGVDYEFCLRLKINGLKIYNVYSEFIDHKSLQPNKLINIFGVKIYIRVYGERRLKDFNRSHKKLLLKSLAAGEYPMFFSFLKSLICFNIHEKFSRSLSRFL